MVHIFKYWCILNTVVSFCSVACAWPVWDKGLWHLVTKYASWHAGMGAHVVFRRDLACRSCFSLSPFAHDSDSNQTEAECNAPIDSPNWQNETSRKSVFSSTMVQRQVCKWNLSRRRTSSANHGAWPCVEFNVFHLKVHIKGQERRQKKQAARVCMHLIATSLMVPFSEANMRIA